MKIRLWQALGAVCLLIIVVLFSGGKKAGRSYAPLGSTAKNGRGRGCRILTPDKVRDLLRRVPMKRRLKPNHLALQRRLKAGIPLGASLKSVDNSTLAAFPPIGDQGIQGSCAAWAAAYYMLTYTAGHEKGWDQNGAENNDDYRFSPAFIYNMQNGGQDSGLTMTMALDMIKYHGCSFLSDSPYDDSDYDTWCTDSTVWQKAVNYRMSGYTIVSDGPPVDDQYIADVKTALEGGQILVFATYIDDWHYAAISDDPAITSDTSYVGKMACRYADGDGNGGHAMTIVGYNDAIWVDINDDEDVNTGEKGAFRIANSWGASWEPDGTSDGGFVWAAYDAFKSATGVSGGPTSRGPVAAEGIAYSFDGLKYSGANQPKGVAHFNISSSWRSDMTVNVGVSEYDEGQGGVEYAPSGAINQDGGSWSVAEAAPGSYNFAFDLTDVWNTASTHRRFWLRVIDHFSFDKTTLHDFMVTYMDSAGQPSSTIETLDSESSTFKGTLYASARRDCIAHAGDDRAVNIPVDESYEISDARIFYQTSSSDYIWSWSVVSKPTGASLTLKNDVNKPVDEFSFKTDKEGDHTFCLHLEDTSSELEDSDEVKITVRHVAPALTAHNNDGYEDGLKTVNNTSVLGDIHIQARVKYEEPRYGLDPDYIIFMLDLNDDGDYSDPNERQDLSRFAGNSAAGAEYRKTDIVLKSSLFDPDTEKFSYTFQCRFGSYLIRTAEYKVPIDLKSLPGGRTSAAGPSPFDPATQATKIAFKLSIDAASTLFIYDTGGNLVYKKELAGKRGGNFFSWDGKNANGSPVSSGVYLYRIVVRTLHSKTMLGKVIVLRR